MIEIESRELADIPVLHAYPVGQKDTPLPVSYTHLDVYKRQRSV